MQPFRTFSPELVDLYINHPSVRPTMQDGAYRLRSAALVHDPRNVFLAEAHGVACFIAGPPGVYEGHVAVIDDHRGRWALNFGSCALALLPTLVDIARVTAEVPLQLPAARWLVRRLGFVSLGADPTGKYEQFVKEL